LQNALHIATNKGHIRIIEFLIKYDADKNILRSQLDIQKRKPRDLDLSNKFDRYFYNI
jgi:Ankyrin repeat.